MKYLAIKTKFNKNNEKKNFHSIVYAYSFFALKRGKEMVHIENQQRRFYTPALQVPTDLSFVASKCSLRKERRNVANGMAANKKVSRWVLCSLSFSHSFVAIRRAITVDVRKLRGSNTVDYSLQHLPYFTFKRYLQICIYEKHSVLLRLY